MIFNFLIELKQIPIEANSTEFILFKNSVAEIKQFVIHYPKEKTVNEQ